MNKFNQLNLRGGTHEEENFNNDNIDDKLIINVKCRVDEYNYWKC